jgi:hypothetical protein
VTGPSESSCGQGSEYVHADPGVGDHISMPLDVFRLAVLASRRDSRVLARVPDIADQLELPYGFKPPEEFWRTTGETTPAVFD